VSASQAGCRGFDPRRSLFFVWIIKVNIRYLTSDFRKY
jgi:hypothetical protein